MPNMLLTLFAALLAHAADKPKDLTLEEALRSAGCRPMVVSNQGPQSENFGQTQIAVEIGAERFVRTDMGGPDGKLNVLRQGKKLCEIEISLLSSVHSVFGKVLMLRFFSGSGSHWDLYDYTGECKPIGRVPDKIAQKFADEIGKLPSCKK